MSNPSTQQQVPRIQKLPEAVIDRIAAGEVIVRPANALKELLENSLDAGSTHIVITVKDGGLKLLQLSDNGCGIRCADLPIVCERFTTSKLYDFEDLKNIRSFGFRGEALASVSHVSNVTITTCCLNETKSGKSASSSSNKYDTGRKELSLDTSSGPQKHDHQKVVVMPSPGYTCEYLNGLPLSPARSCTRTPGTTIMVENLFYNLPIRRQALKNTSEEYSRLLEVVQKYAIHHPSVSFICRKVGQSKPDLMTKGISEDQHQTEKSSTDDVDQIVNHSSCVSSSERELKKCNIKDDLLSQDHAFHTKSSIGEEQDEELSSIEQSIDIKQKSETPIGFHCTWNSLNVLNVIQSIYGLAIAQELAEISMSNNRVPLFELRGFISTPHATLKRSSLILFINNRLIENNTIKRSIENLKSDLFQKNSKYWMYISLCVPTTTIDVNVHPTKKEVIFLHEKRIVVHLINEIEKIWKSHSTAKQFKLHESCIDANSILAITPRNEVSPSTISTSSNGPETPQITKNNSDKVYNTQTSLCGSNQNSLDASTSLSENISPKATATAERYNISTTHPSALRRNINYPAVGQKPDTKETGSKSKIRTDSRQVSLHNFIDFRQSKQLPPSLLSFSNKKQKTRSRSPSSQLPDHGDTDMDDFNQPDALSTVSSVDISFRAFLVPGFADNAVPCGLRIHPTIHPLESVRKFNENKILNFNLSIQTKSNKEHKSDSGDLQSISELKQLVMDSSDSVVTEMIINSSFVGSVDERQVLIQHDTSLIMIDILSVFKEAVYQSLLSRFGQLPTVQFEPSLNLDILINNTAIKDTSGGRYPRFNQSTNELFIPVLEKILPFREMLNDYFGISINKEGKCLSEFPLCCGRYFPGINQLGIFFQRIAFEVSWTEERSCLDGICKALGEFYGTLPAEIPSDIQYNATEIQYNANQTPTVATAMVIDSNNMKNNYNMDLCDQSEETPIPPQSAYLTAAPPLICELCQFVFHPSIAFYKTLRVPVRFLTNGKFKILTTLEKLYRVFERC